MRNLTSPIEYPMENLKWSTSKNHLLVKYIQHCFMGAEASKSIEEIFTQLSKDFHIMFGFPMFGKTQIGDFTGGFHRLQLLPTNISK